MKKLSGGKIALIVVCVILAIIIVIVAAFVSTYNTLATEKETVLSVQSNIDTQLQRRGDLIPNLVATVKQYASHEKEIIDSVTEARAKMVSGQTTEEKLEASDELTSALSKVFAIAESYPELKSNTNFIQLQDELAGTENRISAARQDYNDKAKDFNQKIVAFPKNIIAGMFGFEKFDYFEATKTENPDVGDLFN